MYVHQLPSKRGINHFDSTFNNKVIAIQKIHFFGTPGTYFVAGGTFNSDNIGNDFCHFIANVRVSEIKYCIVLYFIRFVYLTKQEHCDRICGYYTVPLLGFFLQGF